ncbi:protein FAM200A-like [Clavelina lepadiformis]|uniref:protein FAM200A-like n=1 Tax=Clavelina lepadiformis TaxID=159417 RepID=UPI0040419AE6
MLKDEVVVFLTEKQSDLVHHFRNDSWLLKLFYLSDVLENLNKLNLFLQGENTNVFTLKSKIEAFIKKLNIWKQKVENDSFEMFSSTEDFLANNDAESNVIKPLVIDHLSNLLKQFQK